MLSRCVVVGEARATKIFFLRPHVVYRFAGGAFRCLGTAPVALREMPYRNAIWSVI